VDCAGEWVRLRVSRGGRDGDPRRPSPMPRLRCPRVLTPRKATVTIHPAMAKEPPSALTEYGECAMSKVVLLMAASVGVSCALILGGEPGSALGSGRAAADTLAPVGAPTCPHGEAPTNVTIDAPVASAVPASFDPTTASTAQLLKYGFPARPPGGTNSAWQRAVQDQLASPPKPTYSYNCPLSNTPHAFKAATGVRSPASTPGPVICDDPSSNWVGNVLAKGCSGNPNAPFTLDPKNTFTLAEVEFYAEDAPSENGVQTEYSPWVGVGAGQSKTTDEMVQAGIEADSPLACCLEFRPWTEVFPYQTVKYHTMPDGKINLGDLIYVEVYYSGQVAHWYISDQSQSGNYSPFSPTTFTGTTGGSAEWIIEKNTPPLSHWTNPFMMDLSDTTMNLKQTCAGVPAHISVQMYESGQELAKGGAWTDPPTYCDFPLTRTTSF
jgi:Peptidase A4 family